MTKKELIEISFKLGDMFLDKAKSAKTNEEKMKNIGRCEGILELRQFIYQLEDK